MFGGSDRRDELVMLRRHLHAHPELSGHEFATTKLIVDRLEVAGLVPRVLPSGTGVICDIGDPAPTRRVALRADIDALAMPDDKDVSYRSTVSGVAHACGHDVHTAVVLGAGLYLHDLFEAEGSQGRAVRLIFEPSEETVPGGAVEVIASGGVDGVDCILGMHCDPKLDVGQIGLRDGPITWAADMIEMTLTGPGGHTARPELTVNLTELAATLVMEVPRLVSAGAEGEVLLVFGAIEVGDAPNVIPAHGVVRGSLRTPDLAVWRRGEELVSAAVADVLSRVDSLGVASVEIDYRVGVPPVVNDPMVNGCLGRAAMDVLGDGGVADTPQSRGGDSFAWYVERVPGAYARLGTHNPQWDVPRLDIHSGRFDVDERAIEIGARVLACAAVDRLG